MAFSLSGLFGKSKQSAVSQVATGVGLQLRLLSVALVVAIAAVVVLQYLDTQFAVQGQRGIEKADNLQVLSQRIAKDIQLVIQGSPSALQHIIKDHEAIVEILQVLNEGDSTHNPATGESRVVLNEIITVAQRTNKAVRVMGEKGAALENLGNVTQKMKRLNKELRPLVDDLVGNMLSPVASQFAMFVARMEADIAALASGDEITAHHFTS
ncbi:MAG: hypothetical protein ABL860_00120, partial [Candidatus Nitrotoga sp.]